MNYGMRTFRNLRVLFLLLSTFLLSMMSAGASQPLIEQELPGKELESEQELYSADPTQSRAGRTQRSGPARATSPDPMGFSMLNQWDPFDAFRAFPGPIDPIEEMRRAHEEMDLFFGRMTQGFGMRPSFSPSTFQSAQLRDAGDRYVLDLEIPNAKDAEIEASVEGSFLRLRMSQNNEIETRDGNSFQQQRSTQISEQRIQLPGDAARNEPEIVRSDDRVSISVGKKGVRGNRRANSLR